MAPTITWMERTAEHRKAAVLEILHRPRGESEAKAIKRIAAKYNGRILPGGKHLRLSSVSLKRVWQRWKRDPSDSAFNLNYSEGQRIQMNTWLIELLETFAIHNGCTVNEMRCRLKAIDKTFPHTKDSLYRHLPEAVRNRIDTATKLHRKQQKLNREWKNLTAGKNK